MATLNTLPMVQEFSLMTAREKDYIAACRERTFKASKTEIDYGAIFNGNKVQYQYNDDKKDVKITFGKQLKRSKKWIRPSVNTQTGFMSAEIILTEMFEVLNILRHVELDEESFNSIEEALLNNFESNYTEINKLKKTTQFIKEFLSLVGKETQNRIISIAK